MKGYGYVHCVPVLCAKGIPSSPGEMAMAFLLFLDLGMKPGTNSTDDKAVQRIQ
jgi:hypothetical protein